jgi:arsenate reductase (thioredoxin)
MSLPSVLFLCTGNSARSQMAEAFMKKYASDTFIADSAGIEPKGIHPLTIQVMQEMGIDMSGHRSKDLQEFMGRKHSSYIITVCGHADQNCPRGLWSTGQKIHWPFEDPAAFEGTETEKLAKFREVRDQIDQRVRNFIKETV